MSTIPFFRSSPWFHIPAFLSSAWRQSNDTGRTWRNKSIKFAKHIDHRTCVKLKIGQLWTSFCSINYQCMSYEYLWGRRWTKFRSKKSKDWRATPAIRIRVKWYRFSPFPQRPHLGWQLTATKCINNSSGSWLFSDVLARSQTNFPLSAFRERSVDW